VSVQHILFHLFLASKFLLLAVVPCAISKMHFLGKSVAKYLSDRCTCEKKLPRRRRHPSQHTAQPCPDFKSSKACPRWVGFFHATNLTACLFLFRKNCSPLRKVRPVCSHVRSGLLAGATNVRWHTDRGRPAFIRTLSAQIFVPMAGVYLVIRVPQSKKNSYGAIACRPLFRIFLDQEC
jgi:hypothetical protein